MPTIQKMSGCTITSTIIGGVVAMLTITDGGSGYNPADPPKCEIAPSFNAGGSQAAAVLTVGLDGSVNGYTLLTGGSNYPAAPAVIVFDSITLSIPNPESWASLADILTGNAEIYRAVGMFAFNAWRAAYLPFVSLGNRYLASNNGGVGNSWIEPDTTPTGASSKLITSGGVYNSINGNLVPTQTGQSGRYLTTDGTNSSWGQVGSAATITTTSDNSSGSYYIPFSKTTAGSDTALYLDDTTTTHLTFNPSSGTLSCSNISVPSPYNYSVITIATNEAARDTIIPTPYTGQFCFLTNTSKLQSYNGGWLNMN